MRKIGDHVREFVREEAEWMSGTFVFAHDVDCYFIWYRETGEIVWVGEEGLLGAPGYRVAREHADRLNEWMGEA